MTPFTFQSIKKSPEPGAVNIFAIVYLINPDGGEFPGPVVPAFCGVEQIYFSADQVHKNHRMSHQGRKGVIYERRVHRLNWFRVMRITNI